MSKIIPNYLMILFQYNPVFYYDSNTHITFQIAIYNSHSSVEVDSLFVCKLLLHLSAWQAQGARDDCSTQTDGDDLTVENAHPLKEGACHSASRLDAHSFEGKNQNGRRANAQSGQGYAAEGREEDSTVSALLGDAQLLR